MSFWDKVKEFVGVDEDYIDDEFYEDYDDLDDYKDDRNFDDKSDYLDDDYADDDEDMPTYETEVVKPQDRFTRPETNSYKSETRTFSTNQKSVNGKEDRSPRRNSSLARSSNKSSMFVTIREPLTYEDGKIVLDDIMEGKSVVLNLEMLEVDKKTQIFYFVSGGLYSLNGTIQNVTKDIYVLAPHGVEIDGSIKEEISNKNLYQL